MLHRRKREGKKVKVISKKSKKREGDIEGDRNGEIEKGR
jgi:hypothetical protein